MYKSKWKLFFKVQKYLKVKKGAQIKIWNKAQIITENFIKKSIFIYTGKIFKKLFITREHFGYKLGEFIKTRSHSLKKKFQKKKNGSKS